MQAFDADTIATSFAENADRFREVGLTSALVFITFFGFEAIATNAEEIEDPGRTVPRAIFFSMGFVTVVYALVVVVVTLAINNPEYLQFLVRTVGLADLAAAEGFVAENGELAMGYAASFYLGNVGFYVIIVGALFSMLSAANATVLAGSRVKLAMDRRDHLPGRFESLHDRFNTPYNAVLLTGGLILLFVVFFTVLFGPEGELHAGPLTFHMGIEAIAHFADFMLLTGLVVVNVAIIRSRRKYPDVDRGFEVPGVPAVPVVAILANLVLLVNVEPGAFVFGVLAELVGVGLWFGLVGGAPSREEIEEEAPTVVAERPPAESEYQILVPIANPENVEQLMRTALDIAADRDGEVLVLSVVPLPEQTPLSRGQRYVEERRAVVERARRVADEEWEHGGVPVGGTVRIAHHVDRAILHTITQYDCDAVLMGWSGKGPRREVVLGSIVDTVVRDADCDVLVERIGVTGPVESILVPTAGGPHAEFAVEIARAIAHTTGATVEVVNVVSPDASADERERVEALLAEAGEVLADADYETRVIESDDVVDAVVAASADRDLTVIGATREGLLQRLVFGTIPEAVGMRAENTVIMAKRDLDIASRLQRLLGRE